MARATFDSSVEKAASAKIIRIADARGDARRADHDDGYEATLDAVSEAMADRPSANGWRVV